MQDAGEGDWDPLQFFRMTGDILANAMQQRGRSLTLHPKSAQTPGTLWGPALRLTEARQSKFRDGMSRRRGLYGTAEACPDTCVAE